jgi:hypothetical protein
MEHCKLPRRSKNWWGLLIAILAGYLLGAWDGSARAAEVSNEFQLKAAFVYNFAKFVQWPTNRVQQPDNPFVIGIFGTNVFGTELEKITKGRTINGRSIEIKYFEAENDARQAHMLFVCQAEDARVGGLLNALAGSSVLTVGESQAFAAAGGMIQFTRKADKIRWVINTGTAEQAGLKISAHLQRLAISIRKKQ